MKKGLKVLSTSLLLSSLVFAGCSCKKDDDVVKNVSRVENSSTALTKVNGNDLNDYTVLDLYNTLIAADAGNKAVANKVIDFIAQKVLDIDNPKSEWAKRYQEIIDEKKKELAASDAYLVMGEFDESYMANLLRADGYHIPACSTFGTVEKLECDYTDYVNKNFKIDALSTLLKQKYIMDVTLKDTPDILTTKQIRDVEYFTISSSLESKYTDFSSRDFMRDLKNRIAAKEVIDFDSVEKELKDELKGIVEEEYKKIGTSKDATRAILTKYTNNYTRDKSEGYEERIDEVDAGEYSFSKLISSSSKKDAVINEQITQVLLNAKNYDTAIANRRVFAVTDASDNTYYYLVNSNALSNIDAGDVLLSSSVDSSNDIYSIVRFRIINSDNANAEDTYNAVKSLAEESTLASSALTYYINESKNEINVYDDDVKAYLATLYPDIFAE